MPIPLPEFLNQAKYAEIISRVKEKNLVAILAALKGIELSQPAQDFLAEELRRKNGDLKAKEFVDQALAVVLDTSGHQSDIEEALNTDIGKYAKQFGIKQATLDDSDVIANFTMELISDLEELKKGRDIPRATKPSSRPVTQDLETGSQRILPRFLNGADFDELKNAAQKEILDLIKERLEFKEKSVKLISDDVELEKLVSLSIAVVMAREENAAKAALKALHDEVMEFAMSSGISENDYARNEREFKNAAARVIKEVLKKEQDYLQKPSGVRR